MIESLLESLAAGQDLTFDDMRAVTNRIMQGGCSDEQIARLLTSLAAKGETVDEVAGAAAAMREQMTPIRTTRTGVLDTCGTGGGGSVTFNISTAAALVVAAAGVPVAKHGNRGSHQPQRLGRRAGRAGRERRRRRADRRSVSRRAGNLLLLRSAVASIDEAGGADSPPVGHSARFSICWGRWPIRPGPNINCSASARPGCGRCWPRPWPGWECGGRWWSRATTDWAK